MATLAQYYVDPNDNDDLGAGTKADPWGDLEFALESITPGAAGDQINIKSGGSDEALEFALDIITDYGTPGAQSPLVFRGYTTDENDGGIGVIQAPTNLSIMSVSGVDHLVFVDLNLKTSGTANLITCDRQCSFINVDFDVGGSGRCLLAAHEVLVLNCYFHNGSGEAIRPGQSSQILNSFFGLDTNNFSLCCGTGSTSTGVTWAGNVFDIAGTTRAFNPSAQSHFFCNNSIYSESSNDAISINGTRYNINVWNNLVHQNHASGTGIDDGGAANTEFRVYGHNAVYAELGTAYAVNSSAPHPLLTLASNVTLSASPFVDPTNQDFRIKPKVASDLIKAFGYPPSDKRLGLPSSLRHAIDLGGIQRREWPLTHPGMGGGFRG